MARSRGVATAPGLEFDQGCGAGSTPRSSGRTSSAPCLANADFIVIFPDVRSTETGAATKANVQALNSMVARNFDIINSSSCSSTAQMLAICQLPPAAEIQTAIYVPIVVTIVKYM